MPNKIPLVFDPSIGGPEQLQPSDELDIDLNERVSRLEQQVINIINYLAMQGIEVPEIIL